MNKFIAYDFLQQHAFVLHILCLNACLQLRLTFKIFIVHKNLCITVLILSSFDLLLICFVSGSYCLSNGSAYVQVHADELKTLLKIVHSGVVYSRNGNPVVLDTDSKEDILWAIWRILGASSTTRVVFGDGNGFGLLLSVLEGIQPRCENFNVESIGDETARGPNLSEHMEVLDALLHVVTVGAAENPTNRNKLHECISSQTFKRLLQNSGLLCSKFEQIVAERLFDVALERVHSPSQSAYGLPVISQGVGTRSFRIPGAEGEFLLKSSQATQGAAQDDIYNAGAVEVLLCFLLQFTAKLQLRILVQIERLVKESPWNQNALTSAGKEYQCENCNCH